MGGSLKDWSVAWNFVAHRSLAAREPFEFGYAVGGTRPLVRERRGTECAFCAGSLQAGVEVYGGLGTQRHFGLAGTSQYVAPLLAWSPPNGMTLQVSPGFGLTGSSLPFLLRVGVSWEVVRLGQLLREKRLRHSPPHPKDLDRTQ